MKLGGNFSELARELDLSRTLLYLWLHEAERGIEAGERDPRDLKIRELERKIASLEAVIGRQKLESDFFADALCRVEEMTQPRSERGETSSTPKSEGGQRRKAN
jgi:transposase-like protein